MRLFRVMWNPAGGGHSEWHLQQDVVPLLKEDWDMIIAFPPCTHLAVSGARHFEEKRKDGRQQQGIKCGWTDNKVFSMVMPGWVAEVCPKCATLEYKQERKKKKEETPDEHPSPDGGTP